MKMRENKKGFSLVELIIVMAIMVALIAVLAPQFVKYVQRARDASVTDAAESVMEMVKSEYALNNIDNSGDDDGVIIISAEGGNGNIVIKATGVTATSNAPSGYSFKDACGIDNQKKVKSDLAFQITISKDEITGAPVFEMTDSTKDSSIAVIATDGEVDVTAAAT